MEGLLPKSSGIWSWTADANLLRVGCPLSTLHGIAKAAAMVNQRTEPVGHLLSLVQTHCRCGHYSFVDRLEPH